jgi:diguanylate cyclase (GGDEF)-like protein
LATVYSGKTLENYILQNVSKVDQLTGLKNRRAFSGIYAKAYDDERHPCLMMCDIDFFKKVNDTYGHNTGDAVLMHVAAILKNYVGDMGEVVRWGGEEFITCLKDCSLDEAVYDRLKEKEQIMYDAIENHALEVMPTSIEDLDLIFNKLI